MGVPSACLSEKLAQAELSGVAADPRYPRASFTGVFHRRLHHGVPLRQPARTVGASLLAKDRPRLRRLAGTCREPRSPAFLVCYPEGGAYWAKTSAPVKFSVSFSKL